MEGLTKEQLSEYRSNALAWAAGVIDESDALYLYEHQMPKALDEIERLQAALATARGELAEQEVAALQWVQELARVKEATSHYVERFSTTGGYLVRSANLMRDAARQLSSFLAGEGDRYATDSLLEAIHITLNALANDEPEAAPAPPQEGEAAEPGRMIQHENGQIEPYAWPCVGCLAAKKPECLGTACVHYHPDNQAPPLPLEGKAAGDGKEVAGE